MEFLDFLFDRQTILLILCFVFVISLIVGIGRAILKGLKK